MNKEVADFITHYLPGLSALGFTMGGVIGSIAVLLGYGIKKALSFLDR